MSKLVQFAAGSLIMGWLMVGCAPSGPVRALKVGDKAVDFSLPDASGQFMKLSDVQSGDYLVLIFYRGAWCDACVNWLLDLKQDFQKFVNVHVALAAVSTDSISASAAFNTQWRFPFPLLSDTQLRLIDAYGTRDPRGGEHGQAISHPAVVIIDPHKIVRYIQISPNVLDHPDDDEILFEVEKIEKEDHAPTGDTHANRI